MVFRKSVLENNNKCKVVVWMWWLGVNGCLGGVTNPARNILRSLCLLISLSRQSGGSADSYLVLS